MGKESFGYRPDYHPVEEPIKIPSNPSETVFACCRKYINAPTKPKPYTAPEPAPPCIPFQLPFFIQLKYITKNSADQFDGFAWAKLKE